MVRKQNLGERVKRIIRRAKRTVAPIAASLAIAGNAYATDLGTQPLEKPAVTTPSDETIEYKFFDISLSVPLFDGILWGNDGRYLYDFDSPVLSNNGGADGVGRRYTNEENTALSLTIFESGFYFGLDSRDNDNFGDVHNVIFSDGEETNFTRGKAKVLEGGLAASIGFEFLPGIIPYITAGWDEYKARVLTDSSRVPGQLAIFQLFDNAPLFGAGTIISLLDDRLALQLDYQQTKSKGLRASYVEEEPSQPRLEMLSHRSFKADPSYEKSKDLKNKSFGPVGTHSYEARGVVLFGEHTYFEAFALSRGNTDHCGECIGPYAKKAAGAAIGTYLKFGDLPILFGPITLSTKYEKGHFKPLVDFEEGLQVHVSFHFGFSTFEQPKAYSVPRTR